MGKNTIFIFVLSLALLQAEEYRSFQLSPQLTDKPFFNSKISGFNHRFSKKPVNVYHLYDFYKNQAKYHLLNNVKNDLLLPYPGLDGGRRGHWGGTNDVESSAFSREDISKAYPLPRFFRDGRGSYCIRTGGVKKTSIIKLSAENCRVEAIYTRVERNFPNGNTFQKGIDRLGWAISWKGERFFSASPNMWEGELEFKGVSVWNNDVILHQTINKLPILVNMQIENHLEPTFVKSIEFLGDSPQPLILKLPSGILGKKLKIKVFTKGLDIVQATNTIEVRNIKRNSKLQIQAQYNMGKLIEKDFSLIKKLQGGQKKFLKDFTSLVEKNADKSAGKTAYEIDDISVPVNNEYNLPMTLSSITFTPKGNAYIGTLTGEIWKVTNLHGELKDIKWKLCGRGFLRLLGLNFYNGMLYINANENIFIAHDYNNDEEFDFYQKFNKKELPKGDGQELKRDFNGNLYTSKGIGIIKISPNGKTYSIISAGVRNPCGITVRSDGLSFTDSSEGGNYNGTCSIVENQHKQNEGLRDLNYRTFYFPRGIDNSPGSRIYINEKRFGPLGTNLVGVSYGSGNYYVMYRDPNDGYPQMALQTMPGDFAGGNARLALNPADGQLYTIGMDGWGDRAVKEGSIHRIRFANKKSLLPVDWKAFKNGILIKFNKKIMKPDKNSIFVQQWNYVNSLHTYGSNEYSVRLPGQMGHDRLEVESVKIVNDDSLFLEVGSILPAMTTHAYGKLRSIDGCEFELNFFMTINRLRGNSKFGKLVVAKKPMVLQTMTLDGNGNTYQKMKLFFDRVAQRPTVERVSFPEIKWEKDKLDYTWVKKNIIDKQCISCHAKGSPHDFSTYDNLCKVINRQWWKGSKLYGMLVTESMPPYPLPKVNNNTIAGIVEWLKMGAPEINRSSRAQSDNIEIFNGKDLSGWSLKGGKQSFFVRDGAIIGKLKLNTKSGYLVYKEKLKNFELKFDVKLDRRLNSGCQIRSRFPDGKSNHVSGPQVEIADWSYGSIYGENMFEVTNKGEKVYFGYMTKKTDKEQWSGWKHDKWNQFRVLAKEDTVKVWVNGLLVSDLKHDAVNLEGYIGLQVHDADWPNAPKNIRVEGLEVAWKNIVLKKIDEK